MDYEDWQCLQCGKYYYRAEPWSYIRRREGAWSNLSGTLRRMESRERRRLKNESAGGITDV